MKEETPKAFDEYNKPIDVNAPKEYKQSKLFIYFGIVFALGVVFGLYLFIQPEVSFLSTLLSPSLSGKHYSSLGFISPSSSVLSLERTEYDSIERQLYPNAPEHLDLNGGILTLELEYDNTLYENIKTDSVTVDKDQVLCDNYKTYYSTDVLTKEFDCTQIKEDLDKITSLGIPVYTKGEPTETKTIDEKVSDSNSIGEIGIGLPVDEPIDTPNKTIVTYTFDVSGFKEGDTIQIGEHSIVYTVVATSSNIFNVNTTTEPNNITHLLPSTTTPYNSLVAYYPFDSDDYPDRTSVGKIGNGLNFDIARSQIVNFGQASNNLHPTSSAVNYTWIGWVKPQPYGTRASIFSRYGNNGGFNIEMDNGAIASVKDGNFFIWWDNGGGNAVIMDTGTNYEINNWTQITVTYSGDGDDKFRFYKNGILTNTSATASDYNPAAATAITTLGRYSGDNILFYNGTMDEIKIFNRTLEATEIANIYGNESLNVSYSALNTAGMIAQYTMNKSMANAILNSQSDLYAGNITNYGAWTNYDYTNNNNDGTYVGNAHSSNINSIYDDYAVFNGLNDYISIPANSQMNYLTQFTISTWANLNPQADHTLCDKRDATTDSVICLVDAQTMYLRINALDWSWSTRVANRTWVHLVWSYNGSTMMAYYNGVRDVDHVIGSQVIDTTAPFKIGETASSLQLNGSVDEYMIFNSSLNSSQVLQIYQNTSQRFNPTGTATIKFQNITADGNNTINLSMSILENNYQSNVSARIGSWNITQGYNCANESLVGYWNADSNAVDCKTGNSANFVGTANANGKGQFNNTFMFDGTTALINITPPNLYSSLQFNRTGITFSAWVNGTRTGTNAELISIEGAYNLYIQTANKPAILIDGAGVDPAVGTSSVNDGKWHHLVGTSTASGLISVYVDGVLEDTGQETWYNLESLNRESAIGSHPDTGDKWAGQIDEVMIWNKSLSANEVKELYAKGRTGSVGINWTYGAYGNITAPNTNASLSFTPYATNILPEILQIATPSSQFYTSLFGGTIRLDSYESAGAPVDNPPVGVCYFPANGTITNNPNVNYLSNWTDDNGLISYQIYTGNFTSLSPGIGFNFTGLTNSTAIGEFLSTSTQRGWNYRVCDTLGQCSFCLSNMTITFDNHKPNLVNMTESPSDPATYIPNQFYEFNITITDNLTGINTAIIEFNGVNYSSATNQVLNRGNGIYSLNRTNLGAGTYNYYWFANDSVGNNNRTAVQTYTINQATPTITLTIDGFSTNRTVLAGIAVSLNASHTTGQGLIQLISIGNIIGQDANSVLNSTIYTGSGSKNVTAFYPATQNYSAGSLTRWVDLLSTGGSICQLFNSVTRVNGTNLLFATDSYDSGGSLSDITITPVLRDENGNTIASFTYGHPSTGIYRYLYNYTGAGSASLLNGDGCSSNPVTWNAYYGNVTSTSSSTTASVTRLIFGYNVISNAPDPTALFGYGR